MARISFPDNFRWGTATAAYQIEGACNEDGKGLSIWDVFSHTLGKIDDHENGDEACDHYHRYREDIALMRELHYPNYRFSISWPRIYPEGSGAVNHKGLDFYDRLVDELRSRNIEPFITLYHWDLPYELQKSGGWKNRSVADRFADYAETVVRKLGDRVQFWITLNEPIVVLNDGYITGTHAPGKKNNYLSFAKIAHNLLLAHGMTVERLRTLRSDLQIGIAQAAWLNTPLRPEDQKIADLANDFVLKLFMDPIFKRRYPESIDRLVHLFNPGIREDDFNIIARPIDFVGINHYSRNIVRRSANPITHFKLVPPPAGAALTDMGWEIYPPGFYDLLQFYKKEYNNPVLYITENGAAFRDTVVAGRVADPERTNYLRLYLAEVSRAIRDGVDVRGYFLWSFMDNFEWAKGYAKRFGTIYVDYPTQKRIVKDSGYWYSQVCQNNGFEL